MFVYDALIDTIRHERLDVADDLRRALASDALDLAYQPVFDAATRTVVGAKDTANDYDAYLIYKTGGTSANDTNWSFSLGGGIYH